MDFFAKIIKSLNKKTNFMEIYKTVKKLAGRGV